jgi:hypothetical protein
MKRKTIIFKAYQNFRVPMVIFVMFGRSSGGRR